MPTDEDAYWSSARRVRIDARLEALRTLNIARVCMPLYVGEFTRALARADATHLQIAKAKTFAHVAKLAG